MQSDRTTARHIPGLLVAVFIAGVATLAARRLHWPDMLVALGLGLLLAQTLRGPRWSAGLTLRPGPCYVPESRCSGFG